jgi:tetratricopeptide (TPR) repeat protein
VSGRRPAVSAGGVARGNDPCPCGSGQKFKFCCGRERTERIPSQSPATRSAPLWPAGPVAANGERDLGPLTEVSGLRRAAEEFRRIAPALPEAAGVENAVPRQRQAMAERYRARGLKLSQSGMLAAAVSALTEATRLDPRNAGAHFELGCVLLDLGRLEEAVERLQLATALREDAEAYHRLAIALRRQHRDDAAAAAYRRALELQPALVDAHVGLAELLETAGEDEPAAQTLRRAAALLPDAAPARIYSARALMLEGDFPAAESQLRKASELDPTNDEVMKYLGDVLARQGRFTEAVAAFDCALALNPRQFSAFFTTAEITKSTAKDCPRLARVQAALGDPSLGEDDRALLHFAAGKMLDDLGEYETAMQHFDAANQIAGHYAAFDAADFAADVDRLTSRFTPEFFAANTAFGQDDETPLLIVGLPRSGTTLVEQILSRHPAIGGGGEQGFWIRSSRARGTSEATYLTPQAGRELARQYLALLRRLAPRAARVTDKLPFNVLCLGLIHLVLPKARIIQCRRHPVDTCLSMYFTYFRQTISFTNDKGALAAAYRQYARLMDHWRAVLPADRFLEIEYEKLIADREMVTRRLIAFTGLEWDESCLSPERNPRPVNTASLWQARQPVYTTSVARWRHYEPWLGELRQLLVEETDGGQAEAGRQSRRVSAA